ncbi:coproporphyrinogen dehydrogenase HemZ [Neofamilia massiliensis]|uniref:coproporphyrinogen dehydrogenase HemZ n=1 Tax=Neofamilia massiliensis TaxID=1673724 RepID=UPI0006BB88F7|nr:coproporphyrinogen dehydrogenase HemZ [Neofamilia massiliensis]
MIDFIKIAYNKEYLELAEAFVPGISKDEEEVFIERAGDYLKLKTPTFEDQVNLDSYFSYEKTNIKRGIYKLFKKYTNRDLAWGILVGVNPLKLVKKLLDSYAKDQVEKILAEGYFLDRDKIDLAFEIIKKQEPFVKDLRDQAHIYIDIPFCPSKCSYCAYPTYLMEPEKIKLYTASLIKEIETFFSQTQMDFATVYIGGGTPSALGSENLDRLIKILRKYVRNIKEFTVEIGRPDTFDKDLLLMLKENKVDRISINPQSMNDKTLERIGRKHSALDIEKSFKLARDLGFYNINMDLIIGLPGEGALDFERSLNKVLDLGADSISIHSLALKKSSRLSQRGYENDRDLDFEKVRNTLMKTSVYEPYYLYRQKHIYLNLENIGYSRIGKECLYNIAMMEDLGPVIGFGLGATSKLILDKKIKRHMNPRTLKDYLAGSKESALNKIKFLGSE